MNAIYTTTAVTTVLPMNMHGWIMSTVLTRLINELARGEFEAATSSTPVQQRPYLYEFKGGGVYCAHTVELHAETT